ncbi:MAG: extracellular solute-binding protein [Synergistaceae bacterium]|jgi:phosphate transport system substrate-binding protein|nr:extracellular solute-binding protein [Synergistaceae bacterium]
MKKLAMLACVSLFLLSVSLFAPGTSWSAGSGITVVSREDGSGTRGAFVELFGVLKDKVDKTTASAEVTNNTAVMMTSIAGDVNAIGYISLGSLNDTVKALKIDGADATADNIKNGKYKISRPFIIATKGDVSAAAKDFMAFVMSAEGQNVAAASGYIKIDAGKPFGGGKSQGRVVVAGSSSVTPLMEKLVEAYKKLNANVEIEIQQSDSSTGMNAAIDGVCDIGMSSRELKDSEKEKGLKPTVIAMDGIAVIVNKSNPLANLTKDQVRAIFTGEITDWSKVK